jgi:hypothetical protein
VIAVRRRRHPPRPAALRAGLADGQDLFRPQAGQRPGGGARAGQDGGDMRDGPPQGGTGRRRRVTRSGRVQVQAGGGVDA